MLLKVDFEVKILYMKKLRGYYNITQSWITYFGENRKFWQKANTIDISLKRERKKYPRLTFYRFVTTDFSPLASLPKT